MKILLTLLALLNGGYMLIDGLYVTLKGKYIGPEKPGPWAELFYALDLDVFKLGWLFMVYGGLWLVWLFGLWTSKKWAFMYGLSMSILTLWYLPLGTFFSIVILSLLLFARQKTGL